MRAHHGLVILVAVLAGYVLANQIGRLPLVNKLPQF